MADGSTESGADSKQRRRVIDRMLAHPRLSGIGAIASIIALGWVVLQAAGAFSHHSIKYLRLGEAGVSGPLTLTPLHLECGKTLQDVKTKEAREIMSFAPLQGQLCFLSLKMYNSSQEQSQGNGSSNLIVNGKAYRGLTSVPVRLPLIDPGTEETITVIYNLPAEVLPAYLTVRAYEPFADTPGWGPYVYYSLAGAL
jgi:hypothetical protein